MSYEDKSDRSSWLRIDNISKPAAAIAQLWEESTARLGYIREFLKLPFEPDRLALFQGYVNRVMRSDDCLLPGREREVIALVVSLENRCETCIITHAGTLQTYGFDDFQLDVMLANWRKAALSKREKALAEYASKLTVGPDKMIEDDLDILRDLGFSEPELLEIVQIIAIFNATNRMNAGLGVRVDRGAFDKFRNGGSGSGSNSG